MSTVTGTKRKRQSCRSGSKIKRKSKLGTELSNYMNMDVCGIIEDFIKSIPTELVGQVLIHQPSWGGPPKAIRITGFGKTRKSVLIQQVPLVYDVQKNSLDRLCGGSCKLDVGWLNSHSPTVSCPEYPTVPARFRWWKNRTQNEMQCVVVIATYKYYVQRCLDFQYKWYWSD